jgi:hypothetical protein
MQLANILFVLFALFAATGAYFVFAERSRTAGALAVLGVLAFFAALYFGVLRLISSAGLH